MAEIGVLALQGDFAAHASSLRGLGVHPCEVRRPERLESLAGLVIPGGESTTLLNLMRDEPWFEEMRAFHRSGGALLGTCAGAILLARRVTGPEQESLGLIDVEVERNAYGRQVDSFEAELELVGSDDPLRASFIRAPRFLRPGPGVEVLATLDGDPVLIREERVIAATFHTELTGERRLHALFLDLVNSVQKTEHKNSWRRAAGAASRGAVA
jgi:5'-phosphate synthase pdxT subunit